MNDITNQTLSHDDHRQAFFGFESASWMHLWLTQWRTWIVSLASALFFLVTFSANLHAQSSHIPWQTMSEGLGIYSDNNLRIVGVMGQVMTGQSSDGNTVVTSGFLAGLRSSYTGVVAVDETAAGPTGFHLSQNYPNPFSAGSFGNPTTTIDYALKSASLVELWIQDLLGRHISTLVQETQHAGSYTVQWNAAMQSSGLYIYRIEAKSIDGSSLFSDQKMMVLLK